MGGWLRQAASFADVCWGTRRPPDKIVRRRTSRLRALLEFARARSPFYREHYAALPRAIDATHALPPVTKLALMQRFEDWVSDPTITREGVQEFLDDPARVGDLYLGRYALCHTSGSTGITGIFLQDERSMALSQAMTIARGLPGLIGLKRSSGRPSRSERRAAQILATGGHYATYVISERFRKRHPRLARHNRTFSVRTPLPELVQALNAYQPAVLKGYPNAISVLAHEQLEGRLQIRPRLVVTFSELLADDAREQITRSFGCPTRSWYGAAECPCIGFECGEGWMHYNSDWVILEPVSSDYRPLSPGCESDTVLITNLANRVQPILRYDLGDRITIKPEPCACGNPLPALRIAGRRHDIPVFTSGEGESRTIMPVILSTACVETAGVRRSQLVQTAPDRLLVRFDAEPGSCRSEVWTRLAAHLHELLRVQGLPFVQLELDPGAPRPDAASGKFRTFSVDMRARPHAGGRRGH